MRVSVVIPTWNGEALLPACLESLAAQRYRDVETIVVDDGSTDGTCAMLAARFPAVRVVVRPTNRGFGTAVNDGIRAARGELVALLNNDAYAEPTWVEALARAASSTPPEIGFFASRMLSMADPRRIDSAGIDYRVDGFAWNRGSRQLDGPRWSEPREIFGACGGAAAYRRVVFEEAGLYDERYFMWHEDTDMSFRAQLRGYRCLYVPDAVVKHHGGKSTTVSIRDVLVPRNRILTWLKNMPAGLVARHPLAFPRGLVASAWSDFRLGRGRACIRGVVATLPMLRHILAARARVQGRRRVSLDYLESIFTR